jgi:hypothetical protein
LPDDDILDWNITDIPEPEPGDPADPPAARLPAGGAPPAAQPQPAGRRLAWRRLSASRRGWLLLGVIVASAATAVFAFPRLEVYRARLAVQAVIAQQEQAILAGDWETLRGLYAANADTWAHQHIQRFQRHAAAAALPVPWAVPEAQAGWLHDFELLDARLARAAVAHRYRLPGGGAAVFATTHYYAFEAGAWRQAMPPGHVWRDRQDIHRLRLSASFYQADAASATELVERLDALLTELCEGWGCSDEARVSFAYRQAFDSRQSGPATPPLLGSFAFGLAMRDLPPPAPNVSYDFLPSRVAAGYAADAAAEDEVWKVAAGQAVFALARQVVVAAAHPRRIDSPFLYALIARELARQGIDPPELASMQVGNPAYTAEGLWSLPADAWRGIPLTMAQALFMLNAALDGVPVETERALLPLLATAPGPAHWLSQGLGIPLVEAASRLSAAGRAAFPPTLAPAFEPVLALNCAAGPILVSTDGQTAPLFGGRMPGTIALNWSPGGRWLSLTVAGREGVAEPAAGTGQWLPGTGQWLPLIGPLGSGAWASDSVVGYYDAIPVDGDVNSQGQSPFTQPFRLVFFDLSTQQPVELVPPELGDVYAYESSPDGRRALVRFWEQAAIYSPVEQSLDWLGSPSHAVWSPDGSALLAGYASEGTGHFRLAVYDAATGASRTLASSSMPGIPASSRVFAVMPAWSPAGDTVAAAVLHAAVQDTFTGVAAYVAVMRADGSGLVLLSQSSDGRLYHSLSFSADGRYLLAGTLDNTPGRLAALFDARGGGLLRTFSGLQSLAWAPEGHTLALVDDDGLLLLDDPANAGAAGRRVEARGCDTLAWR